MPPAKLLSLDIVTRENEARKNPTKIISSLKQTTPIVNTIDQQNEQQHNF
jgi:hypothetical protein